MRKADNNPCPTNVRAFYLSHFYVESGGPYSVTNL
jgi:hypothetical protein